MVAQLAASDVYSLVTIAVLLVCFFVTRSLHSHYRVCAKNLRLSCGSSEERQHVIAVVFGATRYG